MVVMNIGNERVIDVEDELADLIEILEFLENYGENVSINDVKQILTDRVFNLREQLI